MKPSQLAIQLRRIASKIEASKNPDRTLVARDLKKVIANIDLDMLPRDKITVLVHDAVYEISSEDVFKVESAGDLKAQKAEFYKLAKHIGRPDDFEGIDDLDGVDIQIWIDLNGNWNGLDDLFGHAHELNE